MLVYARQDQKLSATQSIIPPDDAMAIVKASNEEHEKECAEYRFKYVGVH